MISTRRYRWNGLCNPILFCISLAILSFGTPLWAQFLYTPGAGSNSGVPGLQDEVWEYAIDPTTGALTPLPDSPFATSWLPPWATGGFALDPLNRFFYLLNNFVGFEGTSSDVGSIWGYAIGNNGALLPLVGSPHPSPAPQGMVVDPTGRFAYVAGTNASGDGIISGYTIEQATGALTLIAGFPVSIAGCSGPGLTTSARPLADPTGKFVYVYGCYVGGIFGFTIDSATGALTPIPGSPFDFFAGAVVVDPSGKYLYDSGGDVLAIDAASGALTAVPGSPFGYPIPELYSAEASSVAVEPSGKFLYMAVSVPEMSFGSIVYQPAIGFVFGYAIDAATGALTNIQISGNDYNAATGGTNVGSIAVDPKGGFLYVGESGDNSPSGMGIAAFSINADTGQLTSVPGPAVGGVGGVSTFPTAGPTLGLAIANPVTTQLGVSVTPNSGSGASQVFAFQYSDSNGYTHLSLAYAGFGKTAYGDEHTCHVEYVRATNALYLKNDAGTVFLGPVTPGSVGTLSNDQCTLKADESSVSGSGNILTLKLALSFTPAFAGTQGIFMYADDRNGQTTPGRQQRGTWIVP